jgi:hypothetical protein
VKVALFCIAWPLISSWAIYLPPAVSRAVKARVAEVPVGLSVNRGLRATVLPL